MTQEKLMEHNSLEVSNMAWLINTSEQMQLPMNSILNLFHINITECCIVHKSQLHIYSDTQSCEEIVLEVPAFLLQLHKMRCLRHMA
jgi:hypothetical protein